MKITHNINSQGIAKHTAKFTTQTAVFTEAIMNPTLRLKILDLL